MKRLGKIYLDFSQQLEGKVPFSLWTAFAIAVMLGTARPIVGVVMAVAAIFFYFVFATTLNELCDERIDRINFPKDTSRALASGLVSRKQMLAFVIGTGVLALGIGRLAGRGVLVVMVLGMIAAVLYSVPPFKVSIRGAVASFLMPIFFVAVPFATGMVIGNATWTASHILIFLGLYVLFCARVLLKDFRDVQGDVLYGKLTFVLRYGRKATCIASAICWLTGGGLLLIGSSSAWIGISGGFYLIVGSALLARIAKSRTSIDDVGLVDNFNLVGAGLALTTWAMTMGSPDWQKGMVMIGLILVITGKLAWEKRGMGVKLHASNLA